MKKTILFILLTAISFSIFAANEPSVEKSKVKNEKQIFKENICTKRTTFNTYFQCTTGSQAGTTIVTETTVQTTKFNCITGEQYGPSTFVSTETGNTCPGTTIDWISDLP